MRCVSQMHVINNQQLCIFFLFWRQFIFWYSNSTYQPNLPFPSWHPQLSVLVHHKRVLALLSYIWLSLWWSIANGMCICVDFSQTFKLHTFESHTVVALRRHRHVFRLILNSSQRHEACTFGLFQKSFHLCLTTNHLIGLLDLLTMLI